MANQPKFPDELTAAVTAAVARHPTDPATATIAALTTIQSLPGYQSWIHQLVTEAVRNLVYQVRHSANVETKRQAGTYGQPSLVSQTTPEVSRVYSGMYGLYIAGRVLGELRGNELSGIAASQRRTATGLTANAEFIESIRPLVKDDERVMDAVPEKRLAALWNGVTRKSESEVA